MSLDDDLDEVREAHLRAWLSGTEELTPLEIRAVVRGAVDARDKLLDRAHLALSKVPQPSIRQENVMFEIERFMRWSRMEGWSRK